MKRHFIAVYNWQVVFFAFSPLQTLQLFYQQKRPEQINVSVYIFAGAAFPMFFSTFSLAKNINR